MILNFVGAFLIQLAAWATFCHVTYLIQLTLPILMVSITALLRLLQLAATMLTLFITL